MDGILRALSCCDVYGEDVHTQLVANGESPDTVCAGPVWLLMDLRQREPGHLRKRLI
jgi:hypothetical protein